MQRVHAGNTVEDPMISLAAAGANDEFRHSTCHPQNKAHKNRTIRVLCYLERADFNLQRKDTSSSAVLMIARGSGEIG
jgi:hypothetical protein